MHATCTSSLDAARVPIVSAAIVPAADAHAVGCGIALLDRDRLSRLEVVLLDEAQEVFVLIDDAGHGDRGVERAGQQRLRPPAA